MGQQDALLHVFHDAGLLARESHRHSAQAPLPAALTPGRWYLAARADPKKAVAERDETNNVSLGAVLEVVEPGSDAARGAGLFQAERTKLMEHMEKLEQRVVRLTGKKARPKRPPNAAELKRALLVRFGELFQGEGPMG